MALPINIEEFDEYIRQGEPDKKEKAYIWQTAIRKFFLIWSQNYPSSCLLFISPCFNYWCQAAKTFSSKSKFFKKLKTTVKYLSSFSSSKYDIMVITSTILISLP